MASSPSRNAGTGTNGSPTPPKGYVEPNLAFYRRLKDLLAFTRQGLKERGLLTGKMEEKFEGFSTLVAFLEGVSVKELAGQPLTMQEYDEIDVFGGLLENLTLSVMVDEDYVSWYAVESDVDKRIAVVADVHTSQGLVLEEGVGPAHEIYVAVEIDGYLKLVRGAVFSYYEFTRPADDRLTDEKWQAMLEAGKAPPPPVWTGVFLSGTPACQAPTPKYTYSIRHAAWPTLAEISTTVLRVSASPTLPGKMT